MQHLGKQRRQRACRKPVFRRDLFIRQGKIKVVVHVRQDIAHLPSFADNFEVDLAFPLLFDDKVEAMRQLGIYGACFKVAVVMVMFIQAFRYAYEPFIFAKNKSEGNTRAYSEAMKYFIIFSLFIFLGVMFYIDIIKYFIGERYYEGLQVVPIVMLGEFFFGIYG